MRFTGLLMSWSLALAVVVLGGRAIPVGEARLPPIGPFVDPFHGVWGARDVDAPPPETLEIAELRGPVDIVWDDRGVAHVFAGSAHDAYVAQGWITARDRLFQMELAARHAGGRLAEVAGPAALESDLGARRFGLPVAADRALEATMADPRTAEALEAYAAGVNAWIRDLRAVDRPLEYKLLDHHPEAWSPRHTALVLKGMSRILSTRSREFDRARAVEALGADATDRLYPESSPFDDPVVPVGTEWTFDPVPPPPLPGDPADRPQALAIPEAAERDDADLALGSNSWAIAGTHTSSGHAILANDPHLALALPSFWYEIQLSTPEFRATGATLAGVPGVVIGFNDRVAWGVTNGYTDALDWLCHTFDDESLDRYRYDGEALDTEWREERIAVRGGTDRVERVPWTVHGPAIGPPGVLDETSDEDGDRVPDDTRCAARWIGHDASNEMRALEGLQRSASVAEARAALRDWAGPALNFSLADRAGDVAMLHAALAPLRRRGQGRLPGDGSDPRDAWNAFVPFAHLPYVETPEEGFVVSANQAPTDRTYPYDLGIDWAPSDRATRIRELLSATEAPTAEDVAAMQTDVVGPYARRLLPGLLDALDATTFEPDATERDALEALRRWDYAYDTHAVAPIVFDRWQRAVADAVWSDHLERDDGPPLRRPSRDVLTRLAVGADDPAWAPFVDDRTTEAIEGFGEIARSTFRATVEDLTESHGPCCAEWSWGATRPVRVAHVAGLPGLGRDALSAPGQYGTVRAQTRRGGASFRIVVELGDPPRAWSGYPGGQSGDPASRRYDDRIDPWFAGTLERTHVYRSAESASEGVVARTRAVPARDGAP